MSVLGHSLRWVSNKISVSVPMNGRVNGGRSLVTSRARDSRKPIILLTPVNSTTKYMWSKVTDYPMESALRNTGVIAIWDCGTC